MSETPTFGRYAEIPVDQMTPAQRDGYRFLVDGPRGRLPGPYKVWVHNPKLMHAAAPLGQHFTPDQSSLTEREREIAVIVITSRVALGLSDRRPREARQGGGPARRHGGGDRRRPSGLVLGPARAGGLRDGDGARRRRGSCSQGLYDRAVKTLGHERITDIIVLMGYYTAVSLTMNFYDVAAGTPGLAR